MKTAQVAAIMAAAKREAATVGKDVTILVIDNAGIMLGLERVGEPGVFTSIVAEGKAVGAVFMGRDSSQLAAMAERAPAIVSAMSTKLGGRFVPVAGGVVVMRDGEAVGAVGVSGATAEEDEQIAKAGAAAFSG